MARLLSIVPPLAAPEPLEVSIVQSVAGAIAGGRAHHPPAIPQPAPKMRPGEASLAHHGVVFLDELPEFAGIM